MTDHDSITVGDLLNEGRRFVLEVGEYYEGEGFRAIIVFEDFPSYFPSGELTNRSGAAPVLWWRTADEAEAKKLAYSYSEAVLGLNRRAHLNIVLSSMGAQNKARRVTVSHDSETGLILLHNGYGVEMELDEDEAVALYQSLARAMDLPYRDSCSECGHLLDDNDTCCCCDL